MAPRGCRGLAAWGVRLVFSGILLILTVQSFSFAGSLQLAVDVIELSFPLHSGRGNRDSREGRGEGDLRQPATETAPRGLG